MSDRLASFVVDPPMGARLSHYLVAMVLVAGIVAATAWSLGRAPSSAAVAETEEAVLVDLPPVDAGAHPPGDDAPTQQAAAASTGAETAQPVERPPDEPAPAAPSTPDSTEAAPEAPSPAAIIEKPSTPPPVATPAAAAQDAHVTGAPQTSRSDEADAEDAETHRASAHLITLWQRALMSRLQAARHGLSAHEHSAGTAKIAFAIDRQGQLVSERVAAGSGSAVLDAAALELVRRAAPYPSPPLGAGASQLSFVVPISFKH